MQRRLIKVAGQSSLLQERHAEIRAAMRTRFYDAEYIDKFIEVLMRTGWSHLDIDSAVKQDANRNRPAVQALLFHNEHVLDQVRLNQGTYTHMLDTASDPNYALRHQAETELILRRLTPGDLYMLQAAHRASAIRGEDDRPSSEIPNYWRDLWQALRAVIPHVQWNEGAYDPFGAAALALSYLQATISDADLWLTFLRPDSVFSTNVSARFEVVRHSGGFSRMCVFTSKPQVENLYMLACVGVCFGIDERARAVFETLPRVGSEFQFHHWLIEKASNPSFYAYMKDYDDGDQETEAHTGPDTGSGPDA